MRLDSVDLKTKLQTYFKLTTRQDYSDSTSSKSKAINTMIEIIDENIDDFRQKGKVAYKLFFL